MTEHNAEAIVITGGSGFLGSLVAATALMETDATLVLPLREPHTRESVLALIAAEVAAEGRRATEKDLARVVTLLLPSLDRIDEIVPTLRDLGVKDILHCAGCLSYFNVNKLQAGNIDLTRAVLSLGASLGVRRFVYLSTAYSAGFVEGPIPETLHDGPRNDPTDYTRTKREAEGLVAQSGLPFVIVRPSIVIGDSRDGRYGGKPYGIYQLWAAAERYLFDTLPRVVHLVASDKPVNFLHQNAFKLGFWTTYRQLPDGSVIHLASREKDLPTMRELWDLWMNTYGGPREVHLYNRLDDVPMKEVDPQLRLWLDFTAVNSEIASVHWDFQLDTLEALRRDGLVITDASLATLDIAQRRFVADSPRLRSFVERYRAKAGGKPRIIAHPSGATPPDVSCTS